MSALAFAIAGMLVASAAPPATAQTARPLLNVMFQDHAVLQRDRPIVVWGVAKAGERLVVEFNGVNASATADQAGAWRATLPPAPSGGPYTLTARAGSGA